MISVIIPVHNVEQYLARCIDSVLSNTYKDLEIILVENCSTDCSLEICKKYESKYENIKLIVADRAGVSHARNLGIDCAQGEYIAFVDADDYVSPDFYSVLIQCAEQNHCDIVFSDAESGTNPDYCFLPCPLERGKEVSASQYLYNTFLTAQYIYSVVWNKIYRRSLIRDLRFNTQTEYTEDREFNVYVVSRSERIFFIEYPLYYYYRANNDSISNENKNMHRRMHQIYSLQNSLNYLECHFEDQPWSEYAGACLLQNADFRMRRAKEMKMEDLQQELKGIVADAEKRVRTSKKLPLIIKLRFLLEHYFYGLFILLYRIKKLVR